MIYDKALKSSQNYNSDLLFIADKLLLTNQSKWHFG